MNFPLLYLHGVFFFCLFNMGVPRAYPAAGILARTGQSYHSLVQDGEVNETRIRGKQKDLLSCIDVVLKTGGIHTPY